MCNQDSLDLKNDIKHAEERVARIKANAAIVKAAKNWVHESRKDNPLNSVWLELCNLVNISDTTET